MRNTIKYTKIITIPLDFTNTLTIIPQTYHCLAFPRMFTKKKCKIWTKNLIYDKTPYVQLKSLPKSWKYYTTAVVLLSVPYYIWVGILFRVLGSQFPTRNASSQLKKAGCKCFNEGEGPLSSYLMFQVTWIYISLY